jgi:hypothetical protein
MNRARILLTIIGLIIGLAAGLVYSWTINPVEYTDTAPASLRQDFKEDTISLIASAYVATGDLNRARARLAYLGIQAAPEELSRLAQSRLASGRPESEARALAQLASVLGERPSAITLTPPPATPLSATQARPTITSTLPPTRTRTPTPSATPGAPFALVDQQSICDPDLLESQIQVEVLDAAGDGVPAVEILVIWDTGQDRFFTGLKPELGAGYADFTMTPGTVYSLQISESERPISGLIAEDCQESSGESYAGSWRLTFQQPGIP